MGSKHCYCRRNMTTTAPSSPLGCRLRRTPAPAAPGVPWPWRTPPRLSRSPLLPLLLSHLQRHGLAAVPGSADSKCKRTVIPHANVLHCLGFPFTASSAHAIPEDSRCCACEAHVQHVCCMISWTCRLSWSIVQPHAPPCIQQLGLLPPPALAAACCAWAC